MSKRITRRQHRKFLTRIAVSLLLILCIAGTSQLEILHSLVHNHVSHVTHVFGQKLDECDVSIYFNDVENGCHHDSHLVVSDKCDMCDLVYQGDQTILTSHFFSTGDFSANYFDFYKSNLDSYWAVISSSRAPPARA